MKIPLKSIWWAVAIYHILSMIFPCQGQLPGTQIFFVREANEIWLHPKNFNRGKGFTLSHTWSPEINLLKWSGHAPMAKLSQGTQAPLAARSDSNQSRQVYMWDIMGSADISDPCQWESRLLSKHWFLWSSDKADWAWILHWNITFMQIIKPAVRNDYFVPNTFTNQQFDFFGINVQPSSHISYHLLNTASCFGENPAHSRRHHFGISLVIKWQYYKGYHQNIFILKFNEQKSKLQHHRCMYACCI